ncbi:MAG: hypothetical protein H6727_14850 [Myxococcales bacterium]|nr:hypothetical protein [Myxococcales bacterium]
MKHKDPFSPLSKLFDDAPEPAESRVEQSRVPHLLDQEILSYAAVHWGPPSLETWLAHYLPPHQSVSFQIRSEVRAMGLLSNLHQDASGAERPAFRVGMVIDLDIQSPDDTPMFITLLLQRGKQAPFLAYPYEQSDEYRPMKRLELKWSVEEGPEERMFFALFSQVPLLSAEDIPRSGAWSLEQATQAANQISTELILFGHHIRWKAQR